MQQRRRSDTIWAMTERLSPPVGWLALTGLAVSTVGGVVLAVWEGAQQRQTAAAHWSVGLVIVLGLAAAVVVGRRSQRLRSVDWLRQAGRGIRSLGDSEPWRVRPAYIAGVVAWVMLVAAIAAWDLNSFAHQSHYLPTLSYFAGKVTRYRWGRSAVFAGWLAVGAYLVAGWRRLPRRGTA